MFALIYKGKVVQIEEETFEVHSSLSWVDISNTDPIPKVGWLYNGQEFSEDEDLYQIDKYKKIRSIQLRAINLLVTMSIGDDEAKEEARGVLEELWGEMESL